MVLLSAVQPTALVQPSSSLGHSDVARIRNFLRQHDPRGMYDGEIRHMEVTSRDMNLALNYALRNRDRNRSLVELTEQTATLHYTYALPENLLGSYVNMAISVVQAGTMLEVAHLKFGDLTVSGRVVNPVINAIDRYLRGRFEEYRGIIAAVHRVELAPGEAHVIYQWQTGLANQLQDRGRDLFLPQEDRLRVQAYYLEIAKVSRTLQGERAFNALLQHLFTLAQTRTQSGGDARSEHRALFLALGLVVSGSAYHRLLGDEISAPHMYPSRMHLTLSRRGDLAQHFALSAAISAAGGGGLADAVGIFKELNDSRGGSGFSFVDLLADRAGVELATRAMGSDAENIQRRMAARLNESDYMPDITNLPEGLLELEFKSRYQDLDSRDYAVVDAEIERRISACKVYQ
ncbi:MAG: hypothetical protein AB8B81_15505 [Halioglobus sp.]